MPEELEPPSNDVFEITVLGRGLGESVVIHMGDGEWIIIDCFQTRDGRPAPLQFLEEMGVPPNAVKLVVATHWHDDHVKGISDLYRRLPDADFVLPVVLERDEFAAYVQRKLREDDRPFSAGVREILEIETIRSTQNRRPLVLAAAAQSLYLRHPNQTSFMKRVELVALSPSGADISAFFNELEHTTSEHATRTPLPERNHISMACWVHFDNFSGILGADLTQCGNAGGWSAVLSSRTLPHGRADYFKVPHHGSANAHCDEVWSNLLTPQPNAVLAPWALGGGRLPKDSDVARIKELAGALFTAKSVATVSYKPPVAALTQLLKTNKASVTAFPAAYGFVRLQRHVDAGAWSASLGGGAARL